MNKKILYLGLITTLLFTGCGKQENIDNNTNTENIQTESTENTEETNTTEIPEEKESLFENGVTKEDLEKATVQELNELNIKLFNAAITLDIETLKPYIDEDDYEKLKAISEDDGYRDLFLKTISNNKIYDYQIDNENHYYTIRLNKSYLSNLYYTDVHNQGIDVPDEYYDYTYEDVNALYEKYKDKFIYGLVPLDMDWEEDRDTGKMYLELDSVLGEDVDDLYYSSSLNKYSNYLFGDTGVLLIDQDDKEEIFQNEYKADEKERWLIIENKDLNTWIELARAEEDYDEYKNTHRDLETNTNTEYYLEDIVSNPEMVSALQSWFETLETVRGCYSITFYVPLGDSDLEYSTHGKPLPEDLTILKNLMSSNSNSSYNYFLKEFIESAISNNIITLK